METETKPKVLKAIILSILGFAVFMVAYIVILIVAAIIMEIFLRIPLISSLLASLFKIRGDSPDIMLVFISAAISYFVSGALIGKIANHKKTECLSRSIVGWILAGIQALSLVINLLHGDANYVNIILLIAGVVFIYSGKE